MSRFNIGLDGISNLALPGQLELIFGFFPYNYIFVQKIIKSNFNVFKLVYLSYAFFITTNVRYVKGKRDILGP